MKRVLIDCDPGIDDALALILAVKSGGMAIEAITTVTGNLTADRCYRNARKVLALLGADPIPMGQGPLKPLIRPFPSDPFSHGADGLGNTNLPEPDLPASIPYAPNVIVETVNRCAGDITLIATGPLTNVALALMQDPDLPKKVSQLIIIGGAFGFDRSAALNATGDNPVSEWNIYVDPEAAKLVFHAGFALSALGLDVATHHDINLLEPEIDHLKAATTPEAKFALGIIAFTTGRGFGTYTALIDSTAIAAALYPELFDFTTIHVDIETQGELTRGETVTDIRSNFRWTHLPAINAARGADFDAFRNLVVTTLCQ
ncbi:MAG TPA: nucleoside hydrolase [Aggregatilinea sp.]|uniref:nucleoside hydrolase n=1 Tax=Aggregatilinea sp. TaxID=2806333 RepID=UPI002BF8D232|nr:nucleoside hydrolase [Aggregatilinea sp.]HML21990.1 nucleoside hydrolase [Aggregatilinea sp.]